ncbi:hypothetical protein KC906_00860 [Candidatus Kaiserbacteria bacterium]|nr:hypothetical protein [Candidatus Kaiserbacteria bacterium]MCB9812398.1 hypothetical protein [Candidatus Nomurabacteria bacterium]
MNRTLFIIIGAVLIVVLVAVWVYVLFFSNSPTSNTPEFADLDMGVNTDTVVIPEPTITTEPTVDVTGPEQIRQLTTKKVVGYQEVRFSTTSAPLAYYVESGTGHLYSIDLRSGAEKKISGTTIPNTRHAAITPNGAYVMLQSGSGRSAEFIVGQISTTSPSLTTGTIAEDISDFTAAADNTFLYAVQTNSGTIAKRYYPISDTSETLFTVPFREAIIDWGLAATDTHYVYPKANSQLEGYLYAVENGELRRLPASGYGLTAKGTDTGVLFTTLTSTNYQSYIHNVPSSTVSTAALFILPEKCVSSVQLTDLLICGGNLLSDTSRQSLDQWYKGVTTYEDGLWEIDTITGTASYLMDITSATGRNVDIHSLLTGYEDRYLYFINKADSSLWLFDRNPTN